MPQTKKRKGGAPATSIDSREKQLIAKAVDLAEKQIDAGTASSMVVVHFLKLGTTVANLEREKLKGENELLRAKTDALQSVKRTEELISDALKAMRAYTGKEEAEQEDDIDD